MWARHMELMLGLWLAVSPFVFGHAADRHFLWVHDFTAAVVLVAVPLVTYWRPWRRAHLALMGLAVWLLALGWWYTFTAGPTPASQNWMTVGLLLAMFAIVPSEASRPPAWRRR